MCLWICICVCICIWERETPPPCDRGPNPISPIITTVHHDSARRQNPYGILPMMQSTEDQRVLHNDQTRPKITRIYSHVTRGIFPWSMTFQQLAKFLLATMNSIGKMQTDHNGQVRTVGVHNVSVRDSGIEAVAVEPLLGCWSHSRNLHLE